MTNAPLPDSISGIAGTIGRYVKLLIEDTRLNVAEKLTRLMSAIALAALLTIVITVAMVFISIAIGLALAEVVTPLWSFVIVAGFYVLVLALLIFCRKTFIVNPIARFISRLLIEAPQTTENTNDQSTSVS